MFYGSYFNIPFGLTEEVEEPSTKPPGSPLLEPSEDGTQLVNGTEPGPSAGDKRTLTSPADAAIPAKRQRFVL